MVLAGEIERLDAVARADGLVAVGLQQIVEELHVELVVLHDQDGLGHSPAPLPRCRNGCGARLGAGADGRALAQCLNKLVRNCYGKANAMPLVPRRSATGVNA